MRGLVSVCAWVLTAAAVQQPHPHHRTPHSLVLLYPPQGTTRPVPRPTGSPLRPFHPLHATPTNTRPHHAHPHHGCSSASAAVVVFFSCGCHANFNPCLRDYLPQKQRSVRLVPAMASCLSRGKRVVRACGVGTGLSQSCVCGKQK